MSGDFTSVAYNEPTHVAKGQLAGDGKCVVTRQLDRVGYGSPDVESHA